MQISIEHNF